jgi:hypothetical protein
MLNMIVDSAERKISHSESLGRSLEENRLPRNKLLVSHFSIPFFPVEHATIIKQIAIAQRDLPKPAKKKPISGLGSL